MIQGLSASSLQQLQNLSKIEAETTTPAELTKSFGEFLNTALDNVAAQEADVHKKNDLYLAGQVDATELLITSQQAHLSLQLTTQVRNKVIEAYQEIMRIHV